MCARDGMPPADTASYNIMIAAWSRGGDPTRALRLVDTMIGNGVPRDAVTLSSAVTAACKLGRATEGPPMVDALARVMGVRADSAAFSALLSGCVASGLPPSICDGVLCEMDRRGLPRTEFTFLPLVRRARDADEALQVLSEARKRRVLGSGALLRAVLQRCPLADRVAMYAQGAADGVLAAPLPADPLQADFHQLSAALAPAALVVQLDLLQQLHDGLRAWSVFW
jgi:pentatricopeptide repeat protein